MASKSFNSGRPHKQQLGAFSTQSLGLVHADAWGPHAFAPAAPPVAKPPLPPLDVPPLDVPPLEVPPLDVPPLEVPPLEVPPLEVPPVLPSEVELPPQPESANANIRDPTARGVRFMPVVQQSSCQRKLRWIALRFGFSKMAQAVPMRLRCP